MPTIIYILLAVGLLALIVQAVSGIVIGVKEYRRRQKMARKFEEVSERLTQRMQEDEDINDTILKLMKRHHLTEH